MKRWRKHRPVAAAATEESAASADAPHDDTTEESGATLDDAAMTAQLAAWLARFPAEQPLVVMTIYNAFEDVIECLESFRSTTASDVPLLLLDDASPDRRMEQILAPIAARENFLYLRKPANRGVVDSANFAFFAGSPRDVVILNSDIVLPHEWLERLHAAAYSRSNIATVTPLTNNGVLYSVPYRNQPIEHLVNGMTTDQMDALVREASAWLRPIVPTAITFCTYFRRTALDVLGGYDDTFSPGYGEEVDFSQRATITGFANIIADDLFVYHKGSRSFGSSERKRRIQDSHEEIINQRYPWHLPQVQEAESSIHDPLFTVIDRARSRILGMRIAIDATSINNEHVTGTQVGTLGLIRALATRPERDYPLTVIIKDGVRLKALDGVDRLVDAVMTVSEVKRAGAPPFDIVHRPFQINTEDELLQLHEWGTRFIISHLDCIAFSNPKYARSPEHWRTFRDLTRLVFHLADGIAFISQDAADDAKQRGLSVPPDRSEVVYFGVDHDRDVAPQAPIASDRFGERPFLLMLGTNFLHKNRSFGLDLLHELITQYEWPGNLILAGPQIGDGSSSHLEALAKLRRPDLSGRVFVLGNVTSGEKAWLLAQASLVLYPSVYEGFGIVPFEAAERGTPTLTARFSSVGEVLGPDVRYFASLDAAREAATAWSLLTDPGEAARQVAAINARAPRYTWEHVAARVDAFYAQIAAKPSRSNETLGLESSLLYNYDAHYARLAKENERVSAEYERLASWARELDQRLAKAQRQPFYGLFARLSR